MPLTTLTSGASAQGFGAGLRRRYLAEVLADSPLAVWMLDDTSGTTVADASGNSRTLTYYNSPTLAQTGPSANIAKSVLFNGTNQIAYNGSITGMNVAASANWTFETWIKYTSTSFGGRGAGLVASRWSDTSGLSGGKTIGIDLNVDSTAGKIQASSLDSAGTTAILISWAGSLNDGAWHHIVVTSVSGGAMTLYVDNVSRASSSTARYTGTGARGAMIGGFQYPAPGPNDFFPGNVAAVAAYSSTLSTARIQAHYVAGK